MSHSIRTGRHLGRIIQPIFVLLCLILCRLLTHQRLYVALHRVVVPTQVSHEAEARHDDVVIVRLTVAKKKKKEVIRLIKSQTNTAVLQLHCSEM